MYHSTRGKKEVLASVALMEGIAEDGGLYITDISPVKLEEFKVLSYREMAQKIISLYLDDLEDVDIRDAIDKAYEKGFDCQELVELKDFASCSFLELYHGPTIAFKDMALTVLPHLLLKAKKKNNRNEKTIILTATSGDTGAAALNGFKDLPNTEIIVFYPYNGVSDIQERQMLSYQGTNAKVIAVKGNFDDCQSFVKKVFTDSSIKEKLEKKNTRLSSANSINIGRLVPQIVYYFYSYMQLVKREEIKMGDEINFCVPTGNFGNILAGHYAKKMGLPVHKLICASNKNNILTDFFHSGTYDCNREFYKTNSPSMDILISSNLERLLFEHTNDVSSLMEDLKKDKAYHLDIKTDEFFASYANEEETLEAIKQCFKENKYLIDTHTAVAYHVYMDYVKKTNDLTKTVIVSTASPYKFAPSVTKALGLEECDEFTEIINLNKLSNCPIHPSIDKLMNIELSRIVWDKAELMKNLLELLVINDD